MDEELLELQRHSEFSQQAKSSIRLSDRNVVVLVQKLQGVDFKLFHTVSGKEYITPMMLLSMALGLMPSLFCPHPLDCKMLQKFYHSVQLLTQPSSQTKHLHLGSQYIFSDTFIKDLFTRLEKEMETTSFSGSAIDDHTVVKEAKDRHELGMSTMMENANENGNRLGMRRYQKKKKGKSAANTKNSAAEVSLDNQDSTTTKSKRNQKKVKEAQAP